MRNTIDGIPFRRPRSPWRRLLVTGAVTVAVMFALLIAVADRIIFQPPESGLAPASDLTMIEAAPGVRIAVLYLPGPASGYTIFYHHGNAETLRELRPLLEEFRRHGYGVAAYDYEGYGASQGAPSESACYRDAEAVYRWLTGTQRISPEQLIIYGRSVGGGPACYLAERYPAGGLVLESTFRSAFRVLCPVPLPFDRFPNHRRMARITMPLLIFHGRRDEVIAFGHGEALFRLAASPRKKFVAVDGAGHNDLPETAGAEYWRELDAFCRTVAGDRLRP